MKKITTAILIFLGVFLAVFLYTKAPVEAGHTSFNKDRLTEDTIFLAQTMNQVEIQNFLVAQGSCLKDFSSEEPIDYFNYGGPVPASRVIWKAANDWGLNPQVILVTLQKEQSLITGSSSLCNTQENGGRVHKAMGHGCPDGGQCPKPEYYGFSKQIYKGAWQLRWNFERSSGNVTWNDDGNLYYSGPTVQGTFRHCDPNVTPRNHTSSCESIYHDGNRIIQAGSSEQPNPINVYISNRATASLYHYTPYTYAPPCECRFGNFNFVHYMNLWFPRPELIQAEGDARIFVIDAGKKRWIPSQEILNVWGYESLPVMQVSAERRDSIPEIQPLSRVARTVDDPRVYYFDAKVRYWIPSPAVMDSLNKWQEIIYVQKELFNYVSEGSTMSVLIKSVDPNDGGKIYFLDGGTKRAVPDTKHLENLGYPLRPAISLSAQGVAAFPTGPDMTSVVSDGTRSWAIRDGLWRSPLTGLIRDSWNIKDVETLVTPATLKLYYATPISHFVRATGQDKIYLLDGGLKRWVPDPDTFATYGAPSFTQVSPELLGKFADGANLGRFLKNPQGEYFLVDSKRRIRIGTELATLMGLSEPSATSSEIINNLVDGGLITRFIKATNSPIIYLLDGGKARNVPDLTVFNAISGTWQQVTVLTESGLKSFTIGAPLTRPLVQANGEEIYLLTEAGKKHVPNPPIVWLWGYGRFNSTKIDSEAMNLFALEEGKVDIFAKTSNNPTIYIMNETGYLTLADTYKVNWGFSDSKVTTIKQEHLNLFTSVGSASRVIKATNSNAIYLLENGTKRWISSPAAYVSSGLSSEPVTLVSQHIVAIIPDGEQVNQ